MAPLHIDPFAHYSTDQADRVYNDIITNGDLAVGAFGRSGAGMRFSTDAGDHLGNYSLASPMAVPADATAIMQFDFRYSTPPPVINAFAAILDGTTQQVSLCLNPNGTIAVLRGNSGGTTLGTSTYAIPVNTTVHVGWKTVIGNSGSTVVHIWEDDDDAAQVVLTLASVDTQNTANTSWSSYDIGPICTGTNDFSNLIVMDGSGSTLNDLLGPKDVLALWTNDRLAGSLSDWALSSGSEVVPLLWDAQPDDDDTYLYSSTTNAKQSVYVDPIPFPDRTILGAQLYACARATSGSPTVEPLARESSTNYTGSAFTLTTDYTYVVQPYSAMPSGAAFSTAAAFDALQWGVQLTNTDTARLTQVVVAVILDRSASKYNLLTGEDHTVSGDNNLMAGSGNTVHGATSEAHGGSATVIGTKSVLFNQKDDAYTLIDNNTFMVRAKRIVLEGEFDSGTGSSATFSRSLAETIVNGIVTTGSEVVIDSNGNLIWAG